MNAKALSEVQVDHDRLAVADAAAFLRIRQSTLWRWIGKGLVPAYRVGPKRVWLRRADLDLLPVAAPTGRAPTEVKSEP